MSSRRNKRNHRHDPSFADWLLSRFIFLGSSAEVVFGLGKLRGWW